MISKAMIKIMVTVTIIFIIAFDIIIVIITLLVIILLKTSHLATKCLSQKCFRDIGKWTKANKMNKSETKKDG